MERLEPEIGRVRVAADSEQRSVSEADPRHLPCIVRILYVTISSLYRHATIEGYEISRSIFQNLEDWVQSLLKVISGQIKLRPNLALLIQ